MLPPVPSSSVASLIDKIDGLVVAGGRDVDPALYDEPAHEQTDVPDHRRDRFELLMTRAAVEADLPFLAICRGMHILNVARGGTLIQHLPDRLGSESHKPDPVKLTTHNLEISAASKLGRVLGATAPGARRPSPGDRPARHGAPHRGLDAGPGGGSRGAAGPQVRHRRAVAPGGGRRRPIFEALVAAAKTAPAPPSATEVTSRSKRAAKRNAARS